jgi:ferredoxin
MGAEYLVRAGIAKRIDKARARDILVYAREHDAVQMGDNVRKRPTFICNCCRCCCEMLDGFRVARESRHVITSNYVARVAPEECTGCGSCAEACPIGVIDMRDGGGATDPEHRDEHAVVNGDLCLGCGVCHRHCPSGALRLRPIGARAWTPETQMVKMVTQAVERGKLGSLLFHDPTNVTHRVLSRVLGAIFALPPARRLLAQQQIKSRFVGMILDGFSRTRHGWSAKL